MEIIKVLFLLMMMVIIFFGLSIYLQRSAIIAVVKIFRKNNALEVNNAKTSKELGILPKKLIGPMFKRRDYKPQALDFLLNVQVVKVTEDNRLYFSEESLASIQENSSKIGRLFLPSRI
ncbi:MAG: hypothetical protein Q7J85_03535 [Bacillota bacterium]|nr:hypothetical protein [Bacillota bacterium]